MVFNKTVDRLRKLPFKTWVKVQLLQGIDSYFVDFNAIITCSKNDKLGIEAALIAPPLPATPLLFEIKVEPHEHKSTNFNSEYFKVPPEI